MTRHRSPVCVALPIKYIHSVSTHLTQETCAKPHPGKQAGGVSDSTTTCCKCTQKVFDILTNPVRRRQRQLDSVNQYYELLKADVPLEHTNGFFTRSDAGVYVQQSFSII